MEGRSPEERRAAAEARARARAGEPVETGDEELVEGSESRGAGDTRDRASATRKMSRHYGGGDVYLRRRLIAGAAVVVVILLILLLVAC